MPAKPRRPRKPQQPHTERLLRIIEGNLERARDEALRARLTAATKTLRQKREAA